MHGMMVELPWIHWIVSGANAIQFIRCRVEIRRWVDFLNWKAQRAEPA